MFPSISLLRCLLSFCCHCSCLFLSISLSCYRRSLLLVHYAALYFSHSNMSSDFPNVPMCPSCLRVFKTTQGANAHISTSRRCKAYNKGKNPEEPYVPWDELISASTPSDNPPPNILSSPAFDPTLTLDDIDDMAFDLPTNLDPWVLAPNTGKEPGPSSRLPRTFQESSRVSQSLLQPADERFKVPTPTLWGAGHVFKVNPPRSGVDLDGDIRMGEGDSDAGEEPQDARFRPFASELDWKIAQWAVADSSSHAAFDRFLSIPGVRVPFAS